MDFQEADLAAEEAAAGRTKNRQFYRNVKECCKIGCRIPFSFVKSIIVGVYWKIIENTGD